MKIENDLEAIAAVCHEANRVWCAADGDLTQPFWADAPAWQQDSAMNGVEGILIHDNGPEDSHISWLAEKERTGWVYGEVKNPDANPPTHPCIVPYADLPPEQKKKDHLFVGIVKALCE
jgi:RyR domain